MTRPPNHTHFSTYLFSLPPYLILLFLLPPLTSPAPHDSSGGRIRFNRSAKEDETVNFVLHTYVEEDATKDATKSHPYHLASGINAVTTDSKGNKIDDDLVFTIISVMPKLDAEYFALEKTNRQEARLNVILPLDREALKSNHPDVVKEKQGSGEVAEIKIHIQAASENANQTVLYNVLVVDSNDNAPAFEEATLRKRLDENVEPEAVNPLMRVIAVDADSGDNGRVSYRRGNVTSFGIDGAEDVKTHPGNWFDVSANGEINIKRSVDREEIAKFTIVIVASDQGRQRREATSTVTVIIVDVNDSPPRCAETICEVG